MNIIISQEKVNEHAFPQSKVFSNKPVADKNIHTRRKREM